MWSEKLIQSRRIFSGRVLNLRLDKVQLPSGASFEREIVEHHGAVAIVPLIAPGKILMIEQYRRAADQKLLEIPAGTMENNETPEECALRELSEETGLKADQMQKLCTCFLAPGYSTELMHIFLAQRLSKSQKSLEEDEFIEMKELALDKAIAMIRNGGIIDAKTICGLLLVDRLLNSESKA